MKKRGISLLLAAVLCLGTLTACVSPASEGSLGSANAGAGKRLGGNRLIGIALPDESDGRWVRDGETMRRTLEKKGYLVELAYAEGSARAQQGQVKALLDDDCNVIIVRAVDAASMARALNSWDLSDTAVLAYDCVLEECPAVSYSVALDGYTNGRKQGRYLADLLELKKRKKGKNPAHLEIFHQAGNANGRYALEGAMEVLKPYLDRGTLVIPSREQTEEACGVSSAERAGERVKRLMEHTYADGKTLDAVLCTDDMASVWLAEGLERCYTGSVYPCVAGCNGTCQSIELLLRRRQNMTTVEKGAEMAKQAAKMADQMMNGQTVEVTAQGDGHPCDVPAYLYQPMGVSQRNARKRLFDSGLFLVRVDRTVTVPGYESVGAQLEDKTAEQTKE